MKVELPDTVYMRGVPVSKRRVGDSVHIIAGPFNTVCRPRHVWQITALLVAAAENKTTCPHCGRGMQ